MNPVDKDRTKAAIRKIEKLSRLSASSEPNEAAAALRQMQKLMEEYGLTQSDIELSAVGESNVTTKAKNPANYEKSLVGIVEDAFAVKAILSKNIWLGTVNWRFIGVGMSPELAGYAFTVLRRQIQKNRANYIKTKLGRCKKKATITARANAYCDAYVCALYEKVNAFANTEANQVILERFLEERYPNLKTLANRNEKKPSKRIDDQINGYKDGKQAQLFNAMNAQPEQLRLM